MLRRATRKAPLPFLHGDGLRLPFPDGSFDAVTIGFGLRNMASHRAGLAEMRRVLRPGGRLAVLEFTTPRNPLFRLGYLTYFKYLLPAFGNLFSRSRAYSYLAESVLEWPDPRELARSMRSAGFDGVRWSMLSFGIAVLHIGTVKPVPEATP
jgi:demethylmenaquinone methyltransferase/2-methoxy-6-polyprenyl-1,4-benzoquinol methylase